MTKLLPLHLIKAKDREDIIKAWVNMEDEISHRGAKSYFPPYKGQESAKLRLTEAVKVALRWDIGVFAKSLLP